MEDRFTKMLWELGADSPEIRRAIAKSMSTGGGGYSIPTRTLSKATGELEDIHITAFEHENPASKEKLVELIKKVDSMTVGQLANVLNVARIHLTLKEVTGVELTEPEKTLKDIDIASLALHAIMYGSNDIKREKAPEE